MGIAVEEREKKKLIERNQSSDKHEIKADFDDELLLNYELRFIYK